MLLRCLTWLVLFGLPLNLKRLSGGFYGLSFCVLCDVFGCLFDCTLYCFAVWWFWFDWLLGLFGCCVDLYGCFYWVVLCLVGFVCFWVLFFVCWFIVEYDGVWGWCHLTVLILLCGWGGLVVTWWFIFYFWLCVMLNSFL